MAEGEQNILKMVVSIYATDFQKGCGDYTKQRDSGNDKILDLCMKNETSCPFYDGQYQTRGRTQPVGSMNQFDCGIGEGVQVGFCRLQKDAIRLGPAVIFDKKWIRPTPRKD